jgi:SAM-dependent methyltransferase
MPDIDRSEGRRAFGGDPGGYNRARPGYPERIYDILRSRCGLRPGTRTFEIGPGTGQATRDLIRPGAAPLVLIEPDERLAAFLQQEFRAANSVQVRNQTFEDVELPASTFDLGVAATSFHWLQTAPALRKVASLLRPGGWWAMWWTVFGDPLRPDAFHEATQHVLGKLGRSPSAGDPGGPPYALDVAARVAELNETGEFEVIEHEALRWTATLSSEQLRGLFATFSEITRLEPGQREQVLDAIVRVANEQFGGVIEKPIVTSIYTARRR